MSEPEPPKLILVDDLGEPRQVFYGSGRRVDPLQMAMLLAALETGERAACARLDAAPPVPKLEDWGASLKQAEYEAEAAMWRADQPRSPWDRGSRGDKVKEPLAAMMLRLQQPRRARWATPTLKDAVACANCDADTDEGEWRARHSSDAYCTHYEGDA